MQMRMSISLLLCRPSSSGRASRWLISGGPVGVHGRQGRKTEERSTIIAVASFSAKPRTSITVLQKKTFKIPSSRHPQSINSPLLGLRSACVISRRSKGEELEERRGGCVVCRSEEKGAKSMEMRKKAMLWLAFACTVGSLGLLVAPVMVHGRDSTPLSFVKKTVASHSIVIFSKSYCPYCKRAKNVFKELKEDPFVVELDQREDGSKIQDALFELVKRRTVPQVFIDGEHIGGSDDTVEAYRSGRLKKLLGSKQSGDQDLR